MPRRSPPPPGQKTCFSQLLSITPLFLDACPPLRPRKVWLRTYLFTYLLTYLSAFICSRIPLLHFPRAQPAGTEGAVTRHRATFDTLFPHVLPSSLLRVLPHTPPLVSHRVCRVFSSPTPPPFAFKRQGTKYLPMLLNLISQLPPPTQLPSTPPLILAVHIAFHSFHEWLHTPSAHTLLVNRLCRRFRARTNNKNSNMNRRKKSVRLQPKKYPSSATGLKVVKKEEHESTADVFYGVDYRMAGTVQLESFIAGRTEKYTLSPWGEIGGKKNF